MDEVDAAGAPVLPLQRFSVLRSTGISEVEEARAVVARLLTPFRLTLLSTGSEVSVSLSAADLGPVSLMMIERNNEEVLDVVTGWLDENCRREPATSSPPKPSPPRSCS
jgi:hypothetical protein